MKQLMIFLLAAGFLISCKPKWDESQVKTKGTIDISKEEAKKLIAFNPKMIVMDVRTPQEIADGKIKNAIEVDVNDEVFFEKSLKRLDKNKTYLVYCRSGKRSIKATAKMREQGFNKTYNLLGGYNNWKE